MVDWWTGTTPRRRPTAEQRQLAGQWLAQTGRAVTAEAVAELAPHVRVTGKPEPHEVQAFARLVRRGQVPTAGAVRGEMASRSAGAARRRQLGKTRAATVEDLTGSGPAAAAYVCGYRERTGPGRRAAGGGGRVAGDRRSGGRRHRDVTSSGTKHAAWPTAVVGRRLGPRERTRCPAVNVLILTSPSAAGALSPRAHKPEGAPRPQGHYLLCTPRNCRTPSTLNASRASSISAASTSVTCKE